MTYIISSPLASKVFPVDHEMRRAGILIEQSPDSNQYVFLVTFTVYHLAYSLTSLLLSHANTQANTSIISGHPQSKLLKLKLADVCVFNSG